MEFNAEGDPDKAKFVAIVDEYFSLLDTDGSGTITKDEVEEGLIDQMDADGDGKISKEEFLEYLVEDVEDDDGDYAEAAKSWRKLVRQLKEEAKTKAKKDRGALVVSEIEFDLEDSSEDEKSRGSASASRVSRVESETNARWCEVRLYGVLLISHG